MNRRQFIRNTAVAATMPAMASCTRSGSAELSLVPGAPHSAFTSASTAEEVSAGLDLTGKTALVTGCNSGIGFETMRVLALRGAHVIGTGRSMEKARAACESVAGEATPMVLELSDFDSVVACAEEVKAMDLPIDMLICNAGTVASEPLAYGMDLAFVVNHLGHFILVNHLLSQVVAARGRIVVVSSFATLTDPPTRISFGNYSVAAVGGSGVRGGAYPHSKLANALFSLELSRRLHGTGVTVNALHPGVIGTNIFRELPSALQWLIRAYTNLFQKSVEQGAATSVYVASHPNVAGVSGQFFNNCNPVIVNAPENHLHDQTMAARLWEESVALTRDYLPPADYSDA